MKQILFITGNEGKVWQAKKVLATFAIGVENRDLNVTEIQSHDPLEISMAKSRSAFEVVKQPVVICDHAWSIPALKGFPGGYMRDINYWFKPEDILALMSDKKDRSIILTETVVYTDGVTVKDFSADFKGQVIDTVRGKGRFSQERVVVFDGQTQTIAEAIDKNEHARDMTKSAWQLFGEWYVNKETS